MEEFEEGNLIKRDQEKPKYGRDLIPVRTTRNLSEGAVGETVEIESSPIPEQLKQIQAEAADWQDKYLRLYAELDNSKKRIARRYAQQFEEEKEEVLRDMLPLADNLERALANVSGDVTDAGLRRGVEITLEAFLNTLATYKVKPIQAIGQPFDPRLHEAISAVHKPNILPGTVVHVSDNGYTMGDKLLRPARVYVAEA
jgi:molecular chaperone GrpE